MTQSHRTFIVATLSPQKVYEIAYVLDGEIVAGLKVKKQDFIFPSEGLKDFEKYGKQTSDDTIVVDLQFATLNIQVDNKYYMVSGITKDNKSFVMHGKSFARFIKSDDPVQDKVILVEEDKMKRLVERHDNISGVYNDIVDQIDDDDLLGEAIEESIHEIAAIVKLRRTGDLTNQEIVAAAGAFVTLGIYGDRVEDPSVVTTFFGGDMKEVTDEQYRTFSKCVNIANEMKGLDDRYEITGSVVTFGEVMEQFIEGATNPDDVTEEEFERLSSISQQIPKDEVPDEFFIASNSFQQAMLGRHIEAPVNIKTGFVAPIPTSANDYKLPTFATIKLIVRKVDVPLQYIRERFEEVASNKYCVGVHKESLDLLLANFPTEEEHDAWLDEFPSSGASSCLEDWVNEMLLPPFESLPITTEQLHFLLLTLENDEEVNRDLAKYALQHLDTVIEDLAED